MNKPFTGVRVLDFGQGLAAPYCGMLLAQWGADVIKMEPPEGDWLRRVGTCRGAHSSLSLAANRGKRSIAGDLKQEPTLAAIRRIARRCDVVMESFRPGVADRLGIGHADIAADNPEIVYLSVSGFGQQGAYASEAGSDSVLQAFSGMMNLNQSEHGSPRRIDFLVVDMLTGLYAFQAVAAALYGKLAGQGGRYLDVSLLQSTAAFLATRVVDASLAGGTPQPLAVPSGVYRVSDGYVTIAISKEAQFGTLCRLLQRPDLATDPRYVDFEQRAAHAETLGQALRAAFLPLASAQCVALLRSGGLLVSRVNSLEEWLADPHVAHTVAECSIESVGSFRLPHVPGLADPGSPPGSESWPAIGGSAAEVLREFGFAPSDIQHLVGQRLLI